MPAKGFDSSEPTWGSAVSRLLGEARETRPRRRRTTPHATRTAARPTRAKICWTIDVESSTSRLSGADAGQADAGFEESLAGAGAGALAPAAWPLRGWRVSEFLAKGAETGALLGEASRVITGLEGLDPAAMRLAGLASLAMGAFACFFGAGGLAAGLGFALAIAGLPAAATDRDTGCALAATGLGRITSNTMRGGLARIISFKLRPSRASTTRALEPVAVGSSLIESINDLVGFK